MDYSILLSIVVRVFLGDTMVKMRDLLSSPGPDMQAKIRKEARTMAIGDKVDNLSQFTASYGVLYIIISLITNPK